MKNITKEEILSKLNKILQMDYIKNTRPGNAGGVGNTLEDLLEIEENNLSLADLGNFELKAKRKKSKSMSTLFHSTPWPRDPSSIYDILTPIYGWPNSTNEKETSFRMTISGEKYNQKGFKLEIDDSDLYLDFSPDNVKAKFVDWKTQVLKNHGDPIQKIYWPLSEIENRLMKIENVIFVFADTKGKYSLKNEEFKYTNYFILENLQIDRFMEALQRGEILIDFDARTGFNRKPHDHGTKFRFRDFEKFCDLYTHVDKN